MGFLKIFDLYIRFLRSSDLQVTMADELQFVDHSTTDVKLQLIFTDGTGYQGNPLHVHSNVLRKSEFYNTLLSERWSLEKKEPFEITVTSRYSGEIYIKCIQIMYSFDAGKPLSFSNVDEALAILPVASELLFHQCMDECMKYLSAVPWSTKQEVKLRALLLSLEINILGDLSDRLGIGQCKPDLRGLDMLEQTLQKMLSTISSGLFDDGEYIEEYIIAHFKANEPFAETCRSALLKEFRSSLRLAKSKFETPKACSALSWIVNVTERCDWKLFETVLNMFCKDTEIPIVIYQYIGWERQYSTVSHINDSGYSKRLIGLLDRILEALGKGQIITCNAFRVSFLTNWIAVFVNLKDDRFGNCGFLKNRFTESMVVLAETLPLVDQRRIYNIAIKAMNGNRYVDSHTEKVLERWGGKVQNTIKRHNNFFDMTGRI